MSASRLKPSTKRHNAHISMAYGCEKDNNTYCYRRRPDGKTYLHRIVLGYGWENIPFDVTKLSCYGKGEESMTSPTPTKEELLAIYKQCDGQINPIAKKIHKNWGKTKALLVEYGIIDSFGTPILHEKQEHTPPEPEFGKCDGCGFEFSEHSIKITPQTTGQTICTECYAKLEKAQTSEPEQAANQEPAQSEASATEILPQYAPTDNDYNESGQEREDEPQRTTMTRAQYDAMEMNGDRMSALSLFCENQAVEQLRQDWAVDIFKHSRLSRERKLELIGHLLDWRARA